MKYYHCLVVLGTAICIVFAGWNVFEIWEGPCLKVQSTQEPVFGNIRGALGVCRLYYHSTYKYSGKDCLYSIRVTEAEYERQMYAIEK